MLDLFDFNQEVCPRSAMGQSRLRTKKTQFITDQLSHQFYSNQFIFNFVCNLNWIYLTFYAQGTTTALVLIKYIFLR